MTLNVSVSEEEGEVIIKIKGRFDFDIHREFRAAYEGVEIKLGAPKFIVDLTETEYMDSSALGMLLLLREHAGSDRNRVAIVNCDRVTKEVLDIANFDKLFTISARDSD